MGHIPEELGVTSQSRLDFEKGARLVPEKGFGGDPNLVTPVTNWSVSLPDGVRTRLEILADMILPGDQDSPFPSEIGVGAFLEEWLSAPYGPQQSDRAIILNGLSMLDAESIDRFGDPFLDLAEEQRRLMMEWVSGLAGDNRKFFVRLRYLVVGGYFTSDVGMRDVGYCGNIPLTAFPAASPAAERGISEQLQILGLE
jgi:hypothetical protein